jgi:hypothetical protein
MIDIAATKTMLATPCVSGRYVHSYVNALMKTSEAIRAAGGSVDWLQRVGCSDLVYARNSLIEVFLRPQFDDFTHLFMIDDDQDWLPEDAIKLITSGYDFSAAAGILKQDKPCWGVSYVDNDGKDLSLKRIGDTNWFLASHVGAAFVCLTRQCIQRMVREYADLRYTDRDGETSWGLFNPMIYNGRYLGEDFSFCQRWTDICGEIYVASDIDLGHTGAHRWSGAWATDILRQMSEQGERVGLASL